MIGAPRTPADRTERFRAWLEAFCTALEAGDVDALGRLMAIECAWQPDPFREPITGRVAIRAYATERLAMMPGLSIVAEVLGAGATYGMAHWTLSWGEAVAVADVVAARGRADGILLVALDAMGRGAAIREWTLSEGVPPDPA